MVFYQERRTLAGVLSGLLITILYCAYGFSRYTEFGESVLFDLQFWSKAMLITIGGGIVLMMAIQLIYHIFLAISNEVGKEVAKEVAKRTGNCKEVQFEEIEITDVEDEMDKLISLIALRNGYYIIGIGFVASLATLYLKMPPAIMLNTFFLSFLIGSLFEGVTQLYLYRKGVHNG